MSDSEQRRICFDLECGKCGLAIMEAPAGMVSTTGWFHKFEDMNLHEEAVAYKCTVRYGNPSPA